MMEEVMEEVKADGKYMSCRLAGALVLLQRQCPVPTWEPLLVTSQSQVWLFTTTPGIGVANQSSFSQLSLGANGGVDFL
jgi:hypothetical protein